MKCYNCIHHNLFRQLFEVRLILLMIVVWHGVVHESRAQSQIVSIPKDEFTVYTQSTSHEIARGDTLSLEVFILKSRSYQKSKVEMSLSSNLPAGMSIHFSPTEGNIDKSVLQIFAGHDMSPGRYHLIISSTVRYRTKGVILTLNVL